MSFDYDMIVIGGGAAGLTTAGIAASFGARTLLLERHRLGGDCTWTGCIPSKTLLHTARIAHAIQSAPRYGFNPSTPSFDFAHLMDHVRTLRQFVYDEADKPEIYENIGVEVQHGPAHFVDPHTLEYFHDGKAVRITGRYITIATGASALVPPIDGLDTVPYLTNETLFEITTQPTHLLVIGAGPIGIEMAQAFQRLGTQVTVVETSPALLSRDDPELTGMLRAHLEAEGVSFRFDTTVRQVAQRGDQILIETFQGGRVQVLQADTLLVATGRRPNLDTLNLEAAGVDFTSKGITIDDRCRTSQRHIFAVGDVTGRYPFTHMSEHMGKVAASNAIFKIPLKIDSRHVPWVTYTDPELAHVGATETDLRQQGVSFATYRFPYTKLDRAITDGATTGLIKVFAKRWNGKILGATILGAHAGDLISEYALAMRHGITLRQVSDTIHPYPTYGLGVRRAADQWYAQKHAPWLVRLIQKVFGYRGVVQEYDPDRIV